MPEGVLVFTVEGPFFFGAVEEFESALLHTDSDPSGLVIKLANVPFIDLTGQMALKDAVEALEKRGVAVALCCATDDVAARLAKARIAGTVATPATASLAEAIEAVTPRPADGGHPTG